MVDRRLLLADAGALALIAGMRWLRATDVEAAGSFELQKSDSEWRSLLSKAQYEVLRLHRTEIPGSSPLNHEKRKGVFACAGCDLPLFSSDSEIRQPDRLAELLSSAGERDRHRDRPRPAAAAHRSALPPLRRTSRPRVRRWAASTGCATASTAWP